MNYDIARFGESLKNRLEENGITRFTGDDGQVDFEAVIAEFRRQWSNFERGGKYLTERAAANEANDRAALEERGWMGDDEGAARFAGEQASAEDGGINPLTGMPRVFDEQGEIAFRRGVSKGGTVRQRVPVDERGPFRREFSKVMADYAHSHGGEAPKSCGIFTRNAYYVFDIIGGEAVNIHRKGLNARNREIIKALDKKYKSEIYKGTRDSSYWADRISNELSQYLQAGNVNPLGEAGDRVGDLDTRSTGGEWRGVPDAGRDSAPRQRDADVVRFSRSGIFTGSAADYDRPKAHDYGKTSDDDKHGWNYVSFRDDNIRVDHKWTDGQMRFARRIIDDKETAVAEGYPLTLREARNPEKVLQVLSPLVGKSAAQLGEMKLTRINAKSMEHSVDSKAAMWDRLDSSKRNKKLWRGRVGGLSVLDDIIATSALGNQEDPKHYNFNWKKGAKFFRSDTRFAIETEKGYEIYPCRLLVVELKNGERYVYDLVEIKEPTLTASAGETSLSIDHRSARTGESVSTPQIIPNSGAPRQGGEMRLSRSGIFTGSAADYDNIRVDHKWTDGQMRFARKLVGNKEVAVADDIAAMEGLNPKDPRSVEKYILEHLEDNIEMLAGGSASITDKTAKHYAWSKVRGFDGRQMRQARAKAATVIRDLTEMFRADGKTKEPPKAGKSGIAWRCRLPIALPKLDAMRNVTGAVGYYADVVIKDEGHGKFFYDISHLKKNEALTVQLNKQKDSLFGTLDTALLPNRAGSASGASTPQIIPNSAAPRQAGGTQFTASAGAAFSRPVQFTRHVRVADDAGGRGERSDWGTAASWELSRTAPTPLTTRGTRYVSLPLSEMLHLAKALGFSARVENGKPGISGKSGLQIAADVLGVIDRSDLLKEKAGLKRRGLYRNEDAQWCAQHSQAEARAEMERSEGALTARLEKLADDRIHGRVAGGMAAAGRVFADKLAEAVLKLPHGQKGVLGNMQTVMGALEKRVKGNEAEADNFLQWLGVQTQPSQTSQTSQTSRQRKAQMFAAFLMMPKEMEQKAKGWYDAIRSVIAGDQKLAATFRDKLRRKALSLGFDNPSLWFEFNQPPTSCPSRLPYTLPIPIPRPFPPPNSLPSQFPLPIIFPSFSCRFPITPIDTRHHFMVKYPHLSHKNILTSYRIGQNHTKHQ